MIMDMNFMFSMNLEFTAALLLSCTIRVGDSHDTMTYSDVISPLPGYEDVDPPTDEQGRQEGITIAMHRNGEMSLGYHHSNMHSTRNSPIGNQPSNHPRNWSDNGGIMAHNTGEIVPNDFVYGRHGVNRYPAGHNYSDETTQQLPSEGSYHNRVGGPKLRTAKEYFNPIEKYKDKLIVQESPRKQLIKQSYKETKKRKSLKYVEEEGKMKRIRNGMGYLQSAHLHEIIPEVC